METCTFSSAIGTISFMFENDVLYHLQLNSTLTPMPVTSCFEQSVVEQIHAYLAGSVKQLSIPFIMRGSSFQQRVWKVLCRVPYGRVITYGEVALKAGSPKAFQAVGSACGANTIPLIIPCHRIVAKRGIGGFGAGLEIKRKLLAIEGVFIP